MVRRTKTIRQEAAIRSLATGMAATHNTQSGATCLTAVHPRVTNSTSNGREGIILSIKEFMGLDRVEKTKIIRL